MNIHLRKFSKYDFWGFGDLDLVYGDLEMLVNENNLKKYDLLTTHNYHIAGHFTICRNNDYYRNLCFKIKDWQTRLIEEKHYAFDENEWAMLIHPWMGRVHMMHKKILKPLGIHYFRTLDTVNPVLYPKVLMKEYRTSLNPSPDANDDPIKPQVKNKKWVYDVKNGKMIDFRGIELPYLHFLFFKKTPWLRTENYWKKGFYQLDVDIDKYTEILFDNQRIIGE